MAPVCSDLALLWQIGGSGHGWFILVPCSMCLSVANAMGQSWLVTQRNSFLLHVSIVSWLCHLLWPLLCYCHSVLVGADVGIWVCQAWEVRWYCLDNCRKELLFLPLLQSQWGSCVCWLQWRLGRLMIGLPFTGRDPKKKMSPSQLRALGSYKYDTLEWTFNIMLDAAYQMVVFLWVYG